MAELEAARTRETPRLEADDVAFVRRLHGACGGDSGLMGTELAGTLDSMHPRLIVALQMAAADGRWEQEGAPEGFGDQMAEAGASLRGVLEGRLRTGRELLAELLGSGEIRKLDSMISKAAGEGRLDTSFFSVLNMNMRDAALSAAAAEEPGAGGGGEELREEVGASRSSILQHIYTRCQEELEKNVAPGAALLNKLLRTEVPSIRANQLAHYLGPRKTSVTSPDGTTIDLPGSKEPLVPHGELADALEDAVGRVRALEAAGGTDRLSATGLVESMRQVAVEARGVLVQSYGEGSEAVAEFQRDLQPVFRPESGKRAGRSSDG